MPVVLDGVLAATRHMLRKHRPPGRRETEERVRGILGKVKTVNLIEDRRFLD